LHHVIVTLDEARVEVVAVARALFTRFMPQFTQRVNTVIGAPAVLAAIGAVAHRSMSWSKEPRRSVDEFIGLLAPVNWLFVIQSALMSAWSAPLWSSERRR
jgi:hypothetical protein